MANTSSAKKRTRVIERKTKVREMQKSKIKSLIKSVESSISKKDQKTAMEQLKIIDPKLQAAGKGTLDAGNYVVGKNIVVVGEDGSVIDIIM